MITGIQITKAANDDLLNSFWLLDSEKGEARRKREIVRLIGQMQIEAEADERAQDYLDEKERQEWD